MAFFATPPECAVVNIIERMTACAAGRKRGSIRHRPPMASVAVEFRVRPIQREAGHPVVAEVPDFPGAGVVADLAASAQTPFVHIILAVTRDALPFCISVALRRVALPALDSEMSAQQGEPRAAMVESRLLPSFRVMAVAAASPFLAVMYIVLLVTVVAVR